MKTTLLLKWGGRRKCTVPEGAGYALADGVCPCCGERVFKVVRLSSNVKSPLSGLPVCGSTMKTAQEINEKLNEVNAKVAETWNNIDHRIDVFTAAFTDYVKSLDAARDATEAARSVIGDMIATDEQAIEEKKFYFTISRKRLDAIAHARMNAEKALDVALESFKSLADHDDDIKSSAWGVTTDEVKKG